MDWPRPTLVDLAALVWVIVCIVFGFEVADRVRGLGTLPDAVTRVGREVTGIGDALGGVDAPVIGGQFDRAAGAVRDAGTRIAREGSAAQRQVDRAATMLGVAVAVLPIAPLLLLYAPLRVAALRRRRAARRLADAAREDPQLQRLLAHRALMTMPYHELTALGGRPWAELADGRYERLADAELRRTAGSERKD